MRSHAMALLAAGRLDEAERWLRRGQAVKEPLVPAVHTERVGHYLTRARLALARGTPAGLQRAERELRAGLALIAALPSPDRVPRDAMELALAQALARQGRREEGRAVAAAALARLREGHWRRLGMSALLALPPFVAEPTPQAMADARHGADSLRQRLGPQAPLARQIDDALRAVAPG